MRFRNSYIPLNDDVNKLLAFAPSISKDWRDGQRIKSKPYQIESFDIVNGLRDEGWKINGVAQNRNSNTNKIDNHFINMTHPDYKVFSDNGTVANLNISNSCNGSEDVNMNLGAYRFVCSNGLWALDRIEDSSSVIKHTQENYEQLANIICGVNAKTQGVMQKFATLEETELDEYSKEHLAERASLIRFQPGFLNYKQLLNVTREEDRGNGLWTVYNRIQENLTQSGRLVDATGKVLGGTITPREDMRVNKELFGLVHAYA